MLLFIQCLILLANFKKNVVAPDTLDLEKKTNSLAYQNFL